MSSLTEKYDSQDEKALWFEYQDTKSKEIRSYLIEKYIPLVRYVAGKVAIGMPQNIEYDDLVSYGSFGLLDAIEKFNASRDIKFKTYAMTRIKGAIIDELRSQDWIPRSIRKKAKEMEEVISTLENKLGHVVEEKDIAKEMNMSVNELKVLFAKVSGTSIVSLNEIRDLGNENDKVSFIETIKSPANLDPDSIVETDEMKSVIVDVIKQLPEKEKQVIVLYYYEDLTLKEIGKVLKVTESRISQLHTKAIMRLRGKLVRMRHGLKE